MKKVFLTIAVSISLLAEAQINNVSLQASGLTCSMCSNAINKALKSLDFIQSVKADIKTYTFTIDFKQNTIIDFDLIRKKVENSGFTVCAFFANVHFDNVHITNNEPVVIQNKKFLFPGCKEQVIDGDRQIKILDKGFTLAGKNSSNAFSNALPQTYHVTL